MSINVEKITVGKLRTNSYIVYDDLKQGFLVDPSFDIEEIINRISNKQIIIRYIFLTHGHFDHVYMVNEIKEKLESIQNSKVITCINEKGKEVLKDKRQNLIEHYMGIDKEIKIDKFLKDEEIISFSNITAKNILIGGHTIDSSVYYLEDDKIMFSGDTLFFESIGRTDLVMSDENLEIENIKEKILTLDGELIVYPGHGKNTCINNEIENNQYLK